MARRVVNLVPSRATRKVVALMIRDAEATTGADAALRHLDDIRPEQYAALVALLLTQCKLTSKAGRPPLPLQMSDEDRRRGYTQYRQGVRTEFAEAGYREYQRVNQRRRRQRLGLKAVG